ncbi:MAG: hypothetical protein PHW69_00530 [Elusimicrobiaceae bacterium]|nr:hypothetical protein [Elusimicrobiaceae bacterium]
MPTAFFNSLYYPLGGFLVSLVLLLYFISKFAEACGEAVAAEPAPAAEPPAVVPAAQLVQAEPDLFSDFSEKPAAQEFVLSAELIPAEEGAARRTAPGTAAIESEISEFRVQLDEMKYLVEQRKTLHEKQIVDIIRNINGIVNRLETVEPQYLEEIQPSLQYLVFELENIRAAGGNPLAAGRS